MVALSAEFRDPSSKQYVLEHAARLYMRQFINEHRNHGDFDGEKKPLRASNLTKESFAETHHLWLGGGRQALPCDSAYNMSTCRTTTSISKAGRSGGRLGAQHGNYAMASTYVNRCKCICLCVVLHMNQMAFETFMLCNNVVEAFRHRLPTRTLEYSCSAYEW